MRTNHVSGLHFDMQVHHKRHHGHREIDSVITKVTGRALGSHGKLTVKIEKININGHRRGVVSSVAENNIHGHRRVVGAAIHEIVRKTIHRTGWVIMPSPFFR